MQKHQHLKSQKDKRHLHSHTLTHSTFWISVRQTITVPHSHSLIHSLAFRVASFWYNFICACATLQSTAVAPHTNTRLTTRKVLFRECIYCMRVYVFILNYICNAHYFHNCCQWKPFAIRSRLTLITTRSNSDSAIHQNEAKRMMAMSAYCLGVLADNKNRCVFVCACVYNCSGSVPVLSAIVVRLCCSWGWRENPQMPWLSVYAYMEEYKKTKA